MCNSIYFLVFFTSFAFVSGVTYNWKWEITVNKDQPKTSAVIVITNLPVEQSSILIDEFVGGQNYTEIATFSGKESKVKESVEMRAFFFVEPNGTCPPAKAAKTLKLDRISVRFIKSDKTFEKASKDVELKLSCTNATEKVVALKDFKEASKKDCIVKDKYYDHKESFGDCGALCSCDDGALSCVDRCTPFGFDKEECHSVKDYGECCSHPQCKKDFDALKCDTTKVNPDFKPPWAVELSVSNTSGTLSPKNVCGGTIINRHWILTTSACVSTVKSTKIFHPISLSDSINVTKIVLDNEENETRAHLALIRVEPSIAFTESLQQVNLPFPSECSKYANSSCGYYTQSFNGVTNGAYQMMKANKTESSHCSLQHDRRKPVICLQIDKYPKCSNLAGSAVTVERSGGFYLAGYLYDSNSKYDTGCDINQSKYRPMISICKRLSWIRNITLADQEY